MSGNTPLAAPDASNIGRYNSDTGNDGKELISVNMDQSCLSVPSPKQRNTTDHSTTTTTTPVRLLFDNNNNEIKSLPFHRNPIDDDNNNDFCLLNNDFSLLNSSFPEENETPFIHHIEMLTTESNQEESGKSVVNIMESNSSSNSTSSTNNEEINTERQRLRREREEEESLELARRLMAEEAMASYQHHFDLLRESANQLSDEDYRALQQALQEEEEEHEHEHQQHHQRLAEELVEEDDHGNLSYETMLQLGERIGDVKTERWIMIAKNEIEKLPKFIYEQVEENNDDDNNNSNDNDNTVNDASTNTDDSERKCLVCQCEYENKDILRRLPCNHCFHMECIDHWLMQKDACPYCRQCIHNQL